MRMTSAMSSALEGVTFCLTHLHISKAHLSITTTFLIITSITSPVFHMFITTICTISSFMSLANTPYCATSVVTSCTSSIPTAFVSFRTSGTFVFFGRNFFRFFCGNSFYGYHFLGFMASTQGFGLHSFTFSFTSLKTGVANRTCFSAF